VKTAKATTTTRPKRELFLAVVPVHGRAKNRIASFGCVTSIHGFPRFSVMKAVDGRVEPGHDVFG
jgi:hypothetical protein